MTLSAPSAAASLDGDRPHVDRTTRVEIFGCTLDRVDMAQALEAVEGYIATRTPAQHVAINVAKLVAIHDDPELAEIVRRSELVTADGQAVVWASRALGDSLSTRVAGIDLMDALMKRAEVRRWRVYILGARHDVLSKAVAALRAQHPRLELAGYRNGYFTDVEAPAVAAEIRRTSPDILLVAISSPRKEHFLGAYREVIGAPFVMGVGGAVDILAGVTRRAPAIAQRAGLEWAFRLVQEPRRLIRRYALTNTRFIAMVARAWFQQRVGH